MIRLERTETMSAPYRARDGRPERKQKRAACSVTGAVKSTKQGNGTGNASPGARDRGWICCSGWSRDCLEEMHTRHKE